MDVSPLIRVLGAIEALLLIAAASVWWRVYRKPRDDWQGTAALFTAAAMAIGGVGVAALIL